MIETGYYLENTIVFTPFDMICWIRKKCQLYDMPQTDDTLMLEYIPRLIKQRNVI